MNKQSFTLENLKLLDFGKIGAAFDAERQHVVKDCIDRPTDERPRSVSISFKFKPMVDPSANVTDCDSVAVECEITSSLPKRRTKVYTMTPRHDGTLTFHPDLPDEPDGDTMFDPKTGEEKGAA